MKIVALDGRPLAVDRQAWAALERFGTLEVYDYSSAEEIRTRSAGAAILITNKAPIQASLIEASPELKFITLTATGFDCVDITAARRRGIPVSNVPVYGTRSVAQFVFALLLELCHHVNLHDQAVRAGEWTSQPDFALRKTPLHELAGKTMGVVGLGRIGEHSAELAHAFGMEVLAHDSVHRRALSSGLQVHWCELDELFARSDVISLHCPLTPQTAGLVNRERLRQVKPTAYLINTARGPLVVEEDLAAGTQSQAGWPGPRSTSCRSSRSARTIRCLRTQLPDHTPHRLGHRRGTRAAHGINSGQRGRFPRRAADQRGELNSRVDSHGPDEMLAHAISSARRAGRRTAPTRKR